MNPKWTALPFNTLRPRQSCHHFIDTIFRCIFLNEIICISRKVSLWFVRNRRINNILALVEIMAWCRPDNKPLSKRMMISSLMHICITGPQWVTYVRIQFISFSCLLIVHKDSFCQTQRTSHLLLLQRLLDLWWVFGRFFVWQNTTLWCVHYERSNHGICVLQRVGKLL